MKIIFLILLSFFLSVGCERRKLAREDLDVGIQKIDMGDFDSAIVYLQDLSTRDSRPEVKIALATAYVGRAGIKIGDYWELVRSLKQGPITTESIQSNSHYLKNQERVRVVRNLLSPRVQNDLDKLFQMVTAFDLYRERIEFLPYVESGKRVDLQNGIDVLSNIPSPGGRFYRAVLVTTQLRSELHDGFDVWGSIEDKIQTAITHPLEAPFIFCSPLTGDFAQWLSIRFHNTETAAEDIGIAFPSDAPTLNVFAESVSSLQDQIPSVQESLIPRGCP